MIKNFRKRERFAEFRTKSSGKHIQGSKRAPTGSPFVADSNGPSHHTGGILVEEIIQKLYKKLQKLSPKLRWTTFNACKYHSHETHFIVYRMVPNSAPRVARLKKKYQKNLKLFRTNKTCRNLMGKSQERSFITRDYYLHAPTPRLRLVPTPLWKDCGLRDLSKKTVKKRGIFFQQKNLLKNLQKTTFIVPKQ